MNRQNILFVRIFIALFAIFTLGRIGYFAFKITRSQSIHEDKRPYHEELAALAKLPQAQKWIESLPVTTERGKMALPDNLADMTELGFVSWRTEAGFCRYRFIFDQYKQTNIIGFAYCRTPNAPLPTDEDLSKIQYTVLSPHWVRFEIH